MSNEESRMKDGVCPKCQANEVMPAVQVFDWIDMVKVNPANLTARLAGTPKKGLLMDSTPSKISELRAWICGACGYTELYAVNPTELWDAYQEGYR
jgi:predicted nucleic-acid-binding Zn-ribbon protein